ncbi:MAG: CDGSH iron-sulfur domain-containing protein [Chthoniobacterales bacterium]
MNGEAEKKDADGKSYPAEKRIALCRCSASTAKPFRDGHPLEDRVQVAVKAVLKSTEGQTRLANIAASPWS